MASTAKRPDGQWRARYRDSSGREHSRRFARKVDATRWLDEVTASVVTGQYVDPNAGRMTSGSTPRSGVTLRCTVPRARRTSRRCCVGTYPTLGDRPLSTIPPSEVPAWV